MFPAFTLSLELNFLLVSGPLDPLLSLVLTLEHLLLDTISVLVSFSLFLPFNFNLALLFTLLLLTSQLSLSLPLQEFIFLPLLKSCVF